MNADKKEHGMHRTSSSPGLALIAAALIAALVGGALHAQNPGGKNGGGNGNGKSDREKDDKEKPKPLPTDARLLALHRDWVTKVEKLAEEYALKKDLDKARSCYEEILKLVPEYPKARQALDAILQHEATADKKVIDIQANKDWQDTGVTLLPGKPVTITASGTWVFKIEHKVPAAGIPIPKELRDFPLGSLVGIIVSPGVDPKEIKPFLVGEQSQFLAEKPGRLFLRMYDSDVTDNSGKLSVEIAGTFAK